MLVRHGYGVLLFDRRGEGASDGDPNVFGWKGERDLHAAVSFLRSRPDAGKGPRSPGLGTGREGLRARGGGLAGGIARCLASDREARPADGASVAEALLAGASRQLAA